MTRVKFRLASPRAARWFGTLAGCEWRASPLLTNLTAAARQQRFALRAGTLDGVRPAPAPCVIRLAGHLTGILGGEFRAIES